MARAGGGPVSASRFQHLDYPAVAEGGGFGLGGVTGVKVAQPQRGPLPLAAAAERLRRPPGRPRKGQGTESAQVPQASAPSQPRETTGPAARAVPGLCPLTPRLLDDRAAGEYLGVSRWTVRDLEAAGALPRVRLPLPGGRDLRRLLYDRADLDRLIERSKDQ